MTSPKPGAITEERKAGVAESKEMPARASDAGTRPLSTKKAAVVADAGLPLRPGETWQYSANVSKLNNVANLGLKVAGKRNFLGQKAGNLEAFAHTENPLRMVFALD